jgi:hypothetical protein
MKRSFPSMHNCCQLWHSLCCGAHGTILLMPPPPLPSTASYQSTLHLYHSCQCHHLHCPHPSACPSLCLVQRLMSYLALSRVRTGVTAAIAEDRNNAARRKQVRSAGAMICTALGGECILFSGSCSGHLFGAGGRKELHQTCAGEFLCALPSLCCSSLLPCLVGPSWCQNTPTHAISSLNACAAAITHTTHALLPALLLQELLVGPTAWEELLLLDPLVKKAAIAAGVAAMTPDGVVLTASTKRSTKVGVSVALSVATPCSGLLPHTALRCTAWVCLD